MKNLYKRNDILVGSLIFLGLFSFASGDFIGSSLLFAAAAVLTQIYRPTLSK